MACKFNDRGRSPKKNNILFLLFLAIGSSLFAAFGAYAQTPTPSPTPAEEPVTFRGFEVTSSFEVGVRGVSVNGSDNKYRSDFNYRPGFRVFDSSFRLENKGKSSRFLDSLLVTASGWNGDPSGFTRVTVEKIGLYRFDTNIRQVVYFNNLNNNARNGHNADTRHNFGDFDFIIYPDSDKLRIRVGASFNKNNGPGTITTRAYSDEYVVQSKVDTSASDLRGGIDTNLLGFNLSFSYGYRRFNDNTFFTSTSNRGFNTTNTSVINTFERIYPIKGVTQYGSFNVQRTFAKKFDFTARIIYSGTNRDFGFTETITGRDNSNNIVDQDRFNIFGDSKRPQTRGDLGLTYLVTDKLRISETFSFDTFNISGGNSFAEALFTRTSAGGARPPVFTNTLNYRVTAFRRYFNTIEGHYDFSDRFAFNLGYRYSNRRVELLGFTQTLPPATTPTRTLIDEVDTNHAHVLIAGMKVKPMNNWVIYGDLEWGDSDNAFTRLANYKFTNLRLRSRWSFNRFAINLTGITKDNENPSTSTAPPGNYPAGNFNSNAKTRIFSAFVDWSPVPTFSLNSGYTYQWQTVETDIVVNIGTLVRGISRYYMRDHYAFFDMSAQPFKRVTFFASYRHNEDLGQGDRLSVLPNLITSYPFRLFTAETRMAIRLGRNVDWNLGYQYIGYNEAYQPLSVGAPQDYHANLPYTSLRFYFGGVDR